MHRTGATFLAVLVACAAPLATNAMAGAQQQAGGESIDSLLARAQELSYSYDYEAALDLAETAVRADPLHYQANELLRFLHGRLGSSASLQARYRELIAAYPDSAAPYYLLSRAARARDAQEAYLRLALQIDPDYGPALMTLARQSIDRPGSALELASHAVAAMPGDYTAVSGYVSALLRADRDAEAISFLRQMTAQYPHELRFWTRLWSLDLRQLRSSQPRQLREQASDEAFERLRPQIDAQRHRFMDSLEHMEMLASVLIAAGPAGGREAIELWQSIAERYPDHPRAELALLQVMQASRDIDAKLQALAALTESYPGSAAIYPAYQDLITWMIYDERYDEAIELSKGLLELPDPGYDQSGVGRDPRILGMSVYGTTLECLGHAGWFGAAQAPLAKASGQNLDWYGGRTMLRELEERTTVAAEAAAAARSLATSGCEEATVLLTVGRYLAHSGAFRVLGIELIERAIELRRNTPPEQFARNSALVFGSLEMYRELLPYYYLLEGRVDAAERAVDRLYAEQARRAGRFYRIAGEVYEAAGRPEDAKRAYVRALSGNTSDHDFARAALDRLYAGASHEIIVYHPAEAPLLPLARTRVHRVHLGIEAPLRRFVRPSPTLLLLWGPRLDSSRDLAVSLADLHATLAELDIDTLSIAIESSASSAVRLLTRNPIAGAADPGIAMTYDDVAEWGVVELPATLLIDGEGRVLARQTSYGMAPAEWRASWTGLIDAIFGQ